MDKSDFFCFSKEFDVNKAACALDQNGELISIADLQYAIIMFNYSRMTFRLNCWGKKQCRLLTTPYLITWLVS